MSVTRNSSIMAVGTIVSRITGMARDIMIAAAIGLGLLADAYAVGNTVPTTIYTLMLGGTLSAVFVPQLVRHMRADADGGHSFTDRLLTLGGMILLGVTGVAMLLAGPITALYGSDDWSSQTLSAAVLFAYFCLPQIFFYGAFEMLMQVLNARESFAAPMFAPIVNNVVVIATAIIFMVVVGTNPSVDSISTSAIALLGGGTTLGVVLQLLVLIPSLRKVGYRFRPRFGFRGYGLGRTIHVAKWIFGLVLVNQLAYIVITNLATFANALAADEGAAASGLASFQRARLIFILPHSVITISIVTAMLPMMSKAAHSGNLTQVARDVARGARLTSVLLFPAAAMFILMGTQVGQVLYGYGSSSAEEGANVGLILICFAIGLPAFSLYFVFLRGYYALENTRTAFWLNLIFNVFYLGISIPLFQLLPLEWKTPSLALGYSLAYWMILIITWVLFQRLIPDLPTYLLLRTLVRITVATTLATLVTWGFLQLVSQLSTNPFLILLLGIPVLSIVFALLAWRMRIQELRRTVDLVGAKLRRR